MTLDEWRNSDKYIRIQNKSVLVDGIDDLGRKVNQYSGLIPNGNSYLCFRPTDKMVRVPASVTGVYHDNNLLSNAGFTSGDYQVSNGFYGSSYQDSSIFRKSAILAFVPRLYVQLQKLSDFIADIGLNNHFTVRPVFNVPTASYTYGYKYSRVSAIPDNAYVLRSYSIYSNKTDGSSQSLVMSYNYSPKSYETPLLVDMFIPCNSLGTYHATGTNMIPYMRSLLPHYSAEKSPTIYQKYRRSVPLYTGINGNISSSLSGAVNMCSVTSGDDFTANPFMNTNAALYFPNYWATLTSAPSGDFIYYTAADLATWKQLFNASGMPWSADLDVVTSPDGNGLNEPTTPGQPENPVVIGDGTGDNISDKVDYPSPTYIPNATVYDRYFLTPNQMPDIKKFLFSDTFVDNIKRLWTNPAEYVISLVCYPFDVDSTGLTTTSGVVSVGGVSSDIAAAALTDKGVPYFYGGSVMVDNYYNSYLDYEPYTSVDIYIPYIGVRPLNVSQVVGHTLCIGYYIDLNTQQITALIGLDGQGGNLGQVVTQFVGSIGIQTPLSGTSAQDMIRNIVAQTSGLITGVGAIAGGIMGANPALLASGVASTSNALLGGGHTAPSYYGSLSPVSGLYTPQVAYLIINRPRQAMPAAYLIQQGFSSNYSGKVSQFSGYLECASVNIASTNTMTEQEQQEIINLLTGGIYCG